MARLHFLCSATMRSKPVLRRHQQKYVSTVLNGRTALTTTTTTSTATKREQSGFLFFRLVYDDIAMSQFVTQARILSSRPRKKSFFHIPITFCHLQSISLISAWHVCVKTTRAWKKLLGWSLGYICFDIFHESLADFNESHFGAFKPTTSHALNRKCRKMFDWKCNEGAIIP